MRVRLMQSFLLFAALATPAAQIELPTVRGTVTDTRGHALPSAVVYLYDRRTKMVRTYYADPDGRYHFSGVNPEDDYTIHAEDDGISSKSQTVSLSGHKWPRQLDPKIEMRNSISGAVVSPKQITPVLAKAAKGLSMKKQTASASEEVTSSYGFQTDPAPYSPMGQLNRVGTPHTGAKPRIACVTRLTYAVSRFNTTDNRHVK
jgi:Carboxypeptidase regulatory-like domain